MTERDERGRFLPGNAAAKGSGRPKSEDAERIGAALSAAISNGTLPKWTLAFKRKLERADPWATEFLWNRIAGKVPDKQEVTGSDGEPLEIVIRHVRVPYPDPAGPDAGTAAGS